MFDAKRWLRSRKTSVRLSLQFSLLYAGLSALVFLGAFFFTDFEVRDWVTDRMEGDAETFAAIYEGQGLPDLRASITTLVDVSFENARIYQLLDKDGTVLAGNIVTRLPDEIARFIPADDLRLTSAIDDEVAGYWMRQDAIGPYLLVQGSGNHIVAEVLEAVGIALGVGYLVVVSLGLLLGVRVGRTTETRIAEISETLSAAALGNLGARIPVREDGNDDLSRISNGINTTLDQLRRLLESQAQISNDIAHDLRTPLQRLRQRLEALSDSNVADPGDIDGALQQAESIIATFNALLRIAQIEAQDRHEDFVEVDLDQIIANVVDLFGPAAEDNGQSLDFRPTEANAVVLGDANMLTQLFANLVENAILHCPDNAHIRLSVDVAPRAITATVADDGPGIARQNRAKVFERFFRAESSRSSSGNGLGLPLAKAIAEMHRATIAIKDTDHGAQFLVSFSR